MFIVDVLLMYHRLYIFEVIRRKQLRKDSLGGVKVWRCGEGWRA